MPQPMPPPGAEQQGGPPPGGPQGGPPQQGGGPEKVMEVMGMVKDALDSMVQALGDKVTPEAMKALQTANDAYNQFISMVSGGGQEQGPPQGAQQPQDAMAAGNPNARPMA